MKARNSQPLLRAAPWFSPHPLTRALVRVMPRAKSEEEVDKMTGTWGALPFLSMVVAVGLLLIAIANRASRTGQGWSEPLFWLALGLIYGPVAFRMALGNAGRRETIGLVGLLGLGLFLVKILHSPVAYTFNDEFLHWRTADDIARTGHLFIKNPLLPVSSYYPGLEIATNALASTGAMSFYGAGIVLIGAARLMFVLSLFLTYEKIGGSTKVAGIGALIYMANPNFVYFNADFSYESLSLPLLGLVIMIAVNHFTGPLARRRELILLGLLALAGVLTSHHITSFALTAFLLLWAAIHFLRHDGQFRFSPGVLALAALAGCVGWMLSVATITLEYLGPHLSAALAEMTRLIVPDPEPIKKLKAGRQLFQSTSGQVAPLWEQLVGMASVGLVVICLPLGAWIIWRHRRQSSVALATAFSALLYPVSLAFRFTSSGWEAANRASEFLYLGNAFVVAVVVTEFELPGFLLQPIPAVRRFLHHPALLRGLVRWRAPLFSLGAVVMLMGGIIAGWPPYMRLSGTYLVDAGARSVEPQGVGAAQWVRNYLGPANHVATDGFQILLMGSYGEQQVSTTLSGGINALWLLYAPQIEDDQLKQLKKGQIRYVVIDRRLKAKPALATSYYPDAVMEKSLLKFDSVPTVSRIFDDGNIIIYDVGVLSGVR